jgi:hypothetical protein
MSRIHWLLGVAALMLVVAPAMSQEVGQPFNGNDVPFLIGERVLPSQYWLGIQCLAMPEMLRLHLNLPEKQGVLVGGVMKDSPAAKAGFVQYDVLLRAGDKPLRHPGDLMAAVDTAKETKLKIDLIRGGKPRTIELTPAKRPENMVGFNAPPNQADLDTVQQWLESIKPGQEGPLALNMLRPGMILPKDVVVGKPLPGNMSVVITKEGDKPAKIVVKRDKETWETTENKLDTLPADVRPSVEQMLGRHTFGFVRGPFVSGNLVPMTTGTFNVPVPQPGTTQMQPFPGLDPRIEKRFDEMNRRMDKLMQLMEKMSEPPVQKAAPEDKTEQ